MATSTVSNQSDAMLCGSRAQDNAQPYDSIVRRRRKLFGTISFKPPLTTDRAREIRAPQQTRDNVPKERRLQIHQSQRDHRKRKKEYIDALEDEVFRLRNDQKQLNQIADSWKRCFLFLSNLQPCASLQSSALVSLGRLDPRSLICNATGIFIEEWQLPQSRAPRHLVAYEIREALEPCIHTLNSQLKCFDIDEKLGSLLFHNFREEIIPTLSLTKDVSVGYANYLLPLAMRDKMALCSVLAVSASHMRLSRANISSAHSFEYRSIAILGLQTAALASDSSPSMPLTALATILGLLIDDMITCSREFSVLVKLASFWAVKHCSLNRASDETAAFHFLMDQISIMKRMMYPLYRINPSLSPVEKRDQQQMVVPNAAQLCATFSALQNATTKAVEIYMLSRFASHQVSEPGNLVWEQDTLDQLESMLHTLQTTIKDVMPFALGENTLVWIYYIAATRSVSTEHRAFFTSRLADMLQVAGLDIT